MHSFWISHSHGWGKDNQPGVMCKTLSKTKCSVLSVPRVLPKIRLGLIFSFAALVASLPNIFCGHLQPDGTWRIVPVPLLISHRASAATPAGAHMGHSPGATARGRRSCGVLEFPGLVIRHKLIVWSESLLFTWTPLFMRRLPLDSWFLVSPIPLQPLYNVSYWGEVKTRSAKGEDNPDFNSGKPWSI